MYKPAVGKPQDVNGVSVTEHFRDKLVRDKVVLIPHEFTFSGDPRKSLGEQAEKVLFDLVAKCKEDIPGVEIISFHGIRVVGMSPTIIREVDSCSFVTYQGRHYVLITEVKCNSEISKSGQARKKAISQVDTFRDMLRSEIKIPDSVVDNFQVHVFWPNMSPTEACPSCAGRHPSLHEKPPACLQPGTQRRAKPEPPGFHLFQDVTVGDAFSDWVRSIISDPSKAVVSDVYERALGFVTRHCVGVLYDQTVGRFCILGSDQRKLVHWAEQPLEKPLIIYGLSGTGKTISILARIQRISPKLDANHKVLFICFEDNVIEMAEMKLKACQIDLTYIHFENVNSQSCQLGNIFEDETKLHNLTRQGFRYIYVDSAEDLGISTINDLLLKVLDKAWGCNLTQGLQLLNSQKGDFWITMDPYQGLLDSHSLVKGFGRTINWQGNTIKAEVLEKGFAENRFVKLRECFRMPHNLIKHIEAKNVLPTKDLPNASDLPTQGVSEETLVVPDFSTCSMTPGRWLADQVADRLHQRVMKQGIHPGHCALLYDLSAKDNLFPPGEGGLQAFIENVNTTLRAIPVQSQADHMLQLSQDMKESVIFGHNYPNSDSGPAPLLTDPSSSVTCEDTAEFQCERHDQVISLFAMML